MTENNLTKRLVHLQGKVNQDLVKNSIKILLGFCLNGYVQREEKQMKKLFEQMERMLLDTISEVIEFRNDYDTEEHMFHFYTGAKSYLFEALEKLESMKNILKGDE